MLLMWLYEYIIELGWFWVMVILNVSRFDLCVVVWLMLVLSVLCVVFRLFIV